MAKSRKDAEARGCVKVNGREYVNTVVFAQRMGVSRPAISQYIAAGKLSRVDLDGYKGQWLDFEVCRVKFLKLQKHPVKGGSRIKKDNRIIESGGQGQEVKPVPVPTTGTVGEVGMPGLPKDAEGILSYFDPEDPDNADCWEVDDYGEYLMLPAPNNNRHAIDWKKAIDKCLANIRYQQYQKERRELIPRQEVEQSLSLVFPPVTATIMQMPDKYASRINGRLEEMIGRPMTNEEKTIIKALLTDEAEQICHNLQDAVEKALEKDE